MPIETGRLQQGTRDCRTAWECPTCRYCVLLAVFIFCSHAGAQSESAKPELLEFTYAEGYSSALPNQPIDLGFRAFTLHSTPCEGLPITDTVDIEPSRISLRVGEHYFMPDLILRVYDDSGEFIPRVPIWAHIRYRSDVLTFDSDNDRSFRAVAVGEGAGVAYFDVGCRGEGNAPLRIEVPVLVQNEQ